MKRVFLLAIVACSMHGCVHYGFDGSLTYLTANWNSVGRPAMIFERRERRPMHKPRVRFARLLHGYPAAGEKLHLTSSHKPRLRWESTPPLQSPMMPSETSGSGAADREQSGNGALFPPPVPNMDDDYEEPPMLFPEQNEEGEFRRAPDRDNSPGLLPPPPAEANSEPTPLAPEDRIAEAAAQEAVR